MARQPSCLPLCKQHYQCSRTRCQMSEWRISDFPGRDRTTRDSANSTTGKPSRSRPSRFWKTITFKRVVRVQTQDEAVAATQNHETLALVMDGKKPKWLLLRCPNGCGDLLRINLSRSNHPCWRLRVSRNGKISIYPSIDRESGCRAHFFLITNVARLI